jgi:hypothetical protein
MNRIRFSHVLALILVLICVSALTLLSPLPGSAAPVRDAEQSASAVSSPRDVLGFDPGDDRKLADWSQIVEYFKRLGSASNRVSLHEAGLTTERRPFIYALISSEENIRNLPRIREAQRKLADPRLIANDTERERLIRETPAVIAITCSIHSTEIVASQMSMALAYKLATDTSPATSEILGKTVLLLVPSVNPDGIDIVTNWYRKTLGTKYEGTNPPILYHHYAGHDDNRDWFMLTQVETQMLAGLLWREWYPEIVYDIHQQGQYGSRMCMPPFFDPANPNIDPVILREVGTIGMSMSLNLTAAGYKGVVTNSTYDTWWHGGLRTAPYYHNEVGILTEAASARIATPLEIPRERLRDPTRGLTDPLVTATNYPVAWEGGTWRTSDILKMELITTRTALEEAALHRESLIRDFVDAADRAIESGKKDAPYAYIVPAEQVDPPTAARMINILVQQAVEVHRARVEFTADGKKYSAGSCIILMAQPYRADVKCLFEAQHYPDRRLYPGGPAEPPYDVAGWTLPMQMGVGYSEAVHRFEAQMDPVESIDAWNGGSGNRSASSSTDRLYISPNLNNSFALINDLLKQPESYAVSRLLQPVEASGVKYQAGGFVVESARGLRSARSASGSQLKFGELAARAGKLGVGLLPFPGSGPQRPQSSTQINQPRLAVYRSWAPSMDEGWTRWVLEQFGFDYKTVTDADIRAGSLNAAYDVIILPEQGAEQIVAGNRPDSYPAEYTGGIGEEGVKNLKSFAESGGVLICLDSASDLAIKRFGLPVKNAVEGLRRDKFYAPGSIFRAVVDTSQPIAFGMPGEADLYFISGTRRSRDGGTAPPPSASLSSGSERNPVDLGTSYGEGGETVANEFQGSRRDDQALLVSALAFEITDSQRAHSVASYIEGNPLRSGWLLGPEYIAGKSALVDVSLGNGRVILFGFRTQHRAQTWGTFKFLFNSILLGR